MWHGHFYWQIPEIPETGRINITLVSNSEHGIMKARIVTWSEQSA
jgi:hypothetical protein